MDITALPKGPWDQQLTEFVTSKKVAVLIHNLKDDIIQHEFIIDYGNPDHRKFLGKLTFYAVKNRMSIETMDAEQWEKMNK